MSKGHHGAAGIVPVFLDAECVGLLHDYAQINGLLDQDAASQILTHYLKMIISRSGGMADTTVSNTVA